LKNIYIDKLHFLIDIGGHFRTELGSDSTFFVACSGQWEVFAFCRQTSGGSFRNGRWCGKTIAAVAPAY
jgi:hypothetical protein